MVQGSAPRATCCRELHFGSRGRSQNHLYLTASHSEHLDGISGRGQGSESKTRFNFLIIFSFDQVFWNSNSLKIYLNRQNKTSQTMSCSLCTKLLTKVSTGLNKQMSHCKSFTLHCFPSGVILTCVGPVELVEEGQAVTCNTWWLCEWNQASERTTQRWTPHVHDKAFPWISTHRQVGI